MAEDQENRNGSDRILSHPLIGQIRDLVAETLGIRLMVMYPTATGWGTGFRDAHKDLQPAYCRAIQGRPEGARQCRMCHILMAVAASTGGPAIQRCHAGVCALVYPAGDMAIISSCIFTDDHAWEDASAQGKMLGIPEARLRKAFQSLPNLNDQQLRQLKSFMKAMSLAVQTIRQGQEADALLQSVAAGQVHEMGLSSFLRHTDWSRVADGPTASPTSCQMPLLIRVVHELVRQRPDLPLTIKDLAAAARVTPNHLTSLFGQCTGKPFTQYLAEQRIERAKTLLTNVTLNINEIARRVGYDDPGYFARRFRQKTGLSPRAWRQHVDDA